MYKPEYIVEKKMKKNTMIIPTQKRNGNDSASKPGRRPGNNAKSFPDKDGKFELYLFKNDLVKDFRADTKMCMWRRDGSSLLQKYIRAKDDDNRTDVFFTASSVVSLRSEL